MDKEKIKTVSPIVAVSAAIICVVSILFSYRVYVSSRELITEYRAELSAIRQSYAELEKKFTAQKFFENKSVENNTGPGLLKKSPLPSESEDGFADDHRQKIQELEQIVQSTGLDQLAANENLDPAILSKIYEEYALQDLVSNYREMDTCLASGRESAPAHRITVSRRR